MNNVKERISSFLEKEFYFFWVLGLTAGIYAGREYKLFNIYLSTARIIIIAILLIIEVLATRRILLGENLSGVSEENKSQKNCKFLLQYKSLFQNGQSTARLIILVIVPFLILFFIGNSIVSIHKYKESKNIFLSLYKNNNSIEDSITIEGRVSDHPVHRYGRTEFLFTVNKIFPLGDNENHDDFFDTRETVNVELKAMCTDWITRDDYLRLKGKLKKNNCGYLNTAEHSEIIFNVPGESVEKIEPWNFSFRVFKFRSMLYGCLKNAFYSSLESEDACMAEAVILGDRKNVPDYLTEAFKKCGAYHLFAISGLHLSFFVSLIYLILKKIKSSGFMLWAAVFFLAAYNFLVGERASMLRASVMVIFILLARSWNREYSYKILLYLSYIIIVIYNPFFLDDLGFWMSYGSMASLIFIYPPILKLFKKRFISLNPALRYFTKIVLITLSIQVVLFPISAHFFKEVSLISPMANMFVIPAFYILLAILMISSFLIIIWPPVGSIILKSGSVFFDYISKIVKTLSKFDFCIINFDSFPIKNVIVYYIILMIALFAAGAIIKMINIHNENR
ncbi:MAG: ComEC/Rec2 family competence protein [Actinomycetota bacterium]|nr:ComEC/Rec2 family competence protein [Actinomycetota bacterium]